MKTSTKILRRLSENKCEWSNKIKANQTDKTQSPTSPLIQGVDDPEGGLTSLIQRSDMVI